MLSATNRSPCLVVLHSRGMSERAERARVAPDLSQYPPIMETSQVADMLGMSVSHLRQLVRTGRIPAHRMPGGRAIKFYRDELAKWLSELPSAAEVPQESGAKAAATRRRRS
jgi:excisionase family DNA binding protein